MRALSGDSGEAYIDVFVKLSVAMALMFMIVNLPGPIIAYTKLSHMCRQYAKAIEASGEINGGVYSLLSDLESVSSLRPAVSYDGFAYAAGVRRVQLRDRFSVTMEASYAITLFNWSFGPPLVLDIPLRVTNHGIGEVYFKQ